MSAFIDIKIRHLNSIDKNEAGDYLGRYHSTSFLSLCIY